MSAPDATALLDWSHDNGTFVAQHGPDTIHVGKATKHQWRWRVSGPTRGTTIGHALKPNEAMMDALREVGHPDATTPHDENSEPLMKRDDKAQRRLAKADGAWYRANYSGCKRCLVGHAVDGHPGDLMTDIVVRARPLRNLSGGDDGGGGWPGGDAEYHYIGLAHRFGDARVGRAIEARAARVLADRAAERDLASIPATTEPVEVEP